MRAYDFTVLLVIFTKEDANQVFLFCLWKTTHQHSLHLPQFLLQQTFIADCPLGVLIHAISKRVTLEELCKEEETFLQTLGLFERLPMGSHLGFFIDTDDVVPALVEVCQYFLAGVDYALEVLFPLDILVEVVLQFLDLEVDDREVVVPLHHFGLHFLPTRPQGLYLFPQQGRLAFQLFVLFSQVCVLLVKYSVFVDLRREGQQFFKLQPFTRQTLTVLGFPHKIIKFRICPHQLLMELQNIFRTIIGVYNKGENSAKLIALHDVVAMLQVKHASPSQHLNVGRHKFLHTVDPPRTSHLERRRRSSNFHHAFLDGWTSSVNLVAKRLPGFAEGDLFLLWRRWAFLL